MDNISQGGKDMAKTKSDYMSGVEDKITTWLKPVPHLPATWRKWFAENAWWLVLISVILSSIAILGLIVALLTALSFLGVASGYYYSGGLHTGWWVTNTIISMVFLVAIVGLNAAAIGPLRQLKKRGWDLLFLAFLLGVISAIVDAVTTFNPFSFVFSLIFTAIFAAVGAYFLFEIRSHFAASVKK